MKENKSGRPMLSLILPIFNEEPTIAELYERCKGVLSSIGPHEIIFINDGSMDGSYTQLRALADRDECVRIIDFSRNFGQQMAISAGLDFAQGNAVVIMDSDLQDTPETIPKLVAKWEEGFDVVYAKRRGRKDTLFKRLTSFLFYRVLRKFANIDIPEDTGDFRLMDRRVVNEINRLRENARFMRGLTSWVGFRQTAVMFDRHERMCGSTHYPLLKLIRLAVDGLTSFSYVPMKFATVIGTLTAILSGMGIVYALYRKFAAPEEIISGWTFTIIAILFIGSIQLLVLGVIGEYIGRIYTETQRRPLYIIRERVNMDDMNRMP